MWEGGLRQLFSYHWIDVSCARTLAKRFVENQSYDTILAVLEAKNSFQPGEFTVPNGYSLPRMAAMVRYYIIYGDVPQFDDD